MSSAMKLRLPWRADRVLLSVEFEESQGTWSLSIEQGLRVHVARLRLIESPETQVTIAECRLLDEGLRWIRSHDNEPGLVSRRIFNAVLARASRNPSDECISFMRWRLCEAIKSLRASTGAAELSLG